jgi:CelD/BcsL family acetyltransferase involved in cellulose biosynthesis
MLRASVVTEPDGAAVARDAWDALAVAAGRPYCAPAWMLAWWRHLAPPDARLRIVLVHDGEALVGVVPMFLQSASARVAELRMLTAGFTCRVEPLAVPGREADVARSAATALAAQAPDALVLEGLPGDSPWPRLLAEGWPGRGAWRHDDFSMALPMALPAGDGAAWLASRRKGFRKESGRIMRRIEEAGGTVRRAQPAELQSAVEAAVRLYRARWIERGGGTRTSDAVTAMLLEAGAGLVHAGRFDVWLLEGPEGAVGAELFVRAGPESAAWGGGFLPGWARFAPSITLMLAAMREGADEGVERVDLGEGEQPYKQRFTDELQRLRWTTLFPRGRRYPLVRARALPRHARWWARERARGLPPGLRERVRALRRRLP